MRLTRARIVAAVLIGGIVVVIAIMVNRFLLTPVVIDQPSAPPSVAAIRNQWEYNILLPTVTPSCLAYDANGASIRSDPVASNGQALRVTLAPLSTGTCSGASGSTLSIIEAPALESLAGDVSTVSQGRMQFARTAQPAPGGQTEVTLQWHCLNMMCRMTGTTSTVITESVLAQMADSFQVIGPSN